MDASLIRFQKDFESISSLYPDIRISEPYSINGDISIFDSHGFLIDIFSVNFKFKRDYPKGFAEMYELGNEIPKDPDWHKDEQDKCCVCAMPEEIIERQKNNNIAFFIREYAIPFLVNYLHKKIYKFYPNGEYKHGLAGTVQWYQEKFTGLRNEKICEILNFIYNHKYIPKPFEDCICGSRVKFKKCHYKVCNELLLMPNKSLLQNIQILHTLSLSRE